eukprot:gene1440-1670_t
MPCKSIDVTLTSCFTEPASTQGPSPPPRDRKVCARFRYAFVCYRKPTANGSSSDLCTGTQRSCANAPGNCGVLGRRPSFK